MVKRVLIAIIACIGGVHARDANLKHLLPLRFAPFRTRSPIMVSVGQNCDRRGNMAKKEKFDYFTAFEKLVDIAAEEADVLIEAIEGFTTAEELEPLLAKAHEIEHKGDQVTHLILTNVASDFITPFDREDIVELANQLDTVTDTIESIIQRFYMYDVHFMHPRAIEFATIIKKEVKALRKSMSSFRDFKKVKKIRAMVEDVNTYEEQADELHVKSMRELYTHDAENAVRVEVWSRMFDRLEAACDAGEEAADKVATIMLKNV